MAGGSPLAELVIIHSQAAQSVSNGMDAHRCRHQVAAEQTSFPADVCEAALAHSLKDATEAAYFRSDLFDKSRELMLAWAEHSQFEKM